MKSKADHHAIFRSDTEVLAHSAKKIIAQTMQKTGLTKWCHFVSCARAKLPLLEKPVSKKPSEGDIYMRFLKYLLSTFGLSRRSRQRRRTLERLRKDPPQAA